MITAGRVLYALPMAIFGLFHFLAGAQMGGMVPSYLPGGGAFWVYLTGGALILAAVAILIGKKDRLAAILLGVMLLLFVALLHLPGALKGDQMATTTTLKDLALAGAAFFIAGYARDKS